MIKQLCYKETCIILQSHEISSKVLAKHGDKIMIPSNGKRSTDEHCYSYEMILII